MNNDIIEFVVNFHKVIPARGKMYSLQEGIQRTYSASGTLFLIIFIRIARTFVFLQHTVREYPCGHAVFIYYIYSVTFTYLNIEWRIS